MKRNHLQLTALLRRLGLWLNSNIDAVAVGLSISIALGGIVVLVIVAPLGILPEWLGLGPQIQTVTTTPTGQFQIQPSKTLWDWMELLIVPLVIALGAFFLNRSERRVELEIAEKRAQDKALQAYLDQMAILLFERDLRTSQPDDQVRNVARAITLAVLRMLDGTRRATVLQFLYEVGLIGTATEDAIICLEYADFREAQLGQLDLQHVNLCRANLRNANLRWTRLENAKLKNADLRKANLEHAHLDHACMKEAVLQGANLQRTYLIKTQLQLAMLKQAHLEFANLHEANLTGAIVREAIANSQTTWPRGFDWQGNGVILRHR